MRNGRYITADNLRGLPGPNSEPGQRIQNVRGLYQDRRVARLQAKWLSKLRTGEEDPDQL